MKGFVSTLTTIPRLGDQLQRKPLDVGLWSVYKVGLSQMRAIAIFPCHSLLYQLTSIAYNILKLPSPNKSVGEPCFHLS